MANCGARLVIQPIETLKISIPAVAPVAMRTLPICVVDKSEPYGGEYSITPSGVEQIIPIAGKKAVQDITINPIPSNYGLITWNGSVITVS